MKHRGEPLPTWWLQIECVLVPVFVVVLLALTYAFFTELKTWDTQQQTTATPLR